MKRLIIAAALAAGIALVGAGAALATDEGTTLGKPLRAESVTVVD